MTPSELHHHDDTPQTIVGPPTGVAEATPLTAAHSAPLDAAPSGPVAAGERLAHIDVLRGFALFGILQVNMALFGQPLYILFTDFTRNTTAADAVVDFAVAWLCEGKFYALFSFLFGFGFALQMRRVQSRGDHFVPLYTRRLLVLLLFGAAHALLLWYGDILLLYAVLGFLLLALGKVSNRVLGIIGVSVYAMPFLVSWVFVGALSLASLDPTGAAEARIAEELRRAAMNWFDWAMYSIRTYSEGSWRQIFMHRLQNYRDCFVGLLFITPVVLAMFLLGLNVARSGILHHPDRHPGLFRRLVVYGLPLGLLGNLLYAAAEVWGTRSQWTWHIAAGYCAYGLTMPLLTFGYVAALLLALQTPHGRFLLAPLAATGRLALSNYILQSVVCTTIFYSYGLGWFGELSPAGGALLGVAIFVGQLPLSVLWLSFFRLGPLEWLWRTLTYLRWQPMLR